jgi:hypothetical protein
MCFHPQVRGETPTLLGPLERANLNHWTRVLYFFLEYRMMDKAQNPVILSVIHHSQNPLESTSNK